MTRSGRPLPDPDGLRRDLEKKRDPRLPSELVDLLVRLHELRVDDQRFTLQRISDVAARIAGTDSGLGYKRINEALLAKSAAVPKPAVREALIELYCAKDPENRSADELRDELVALEDSARSALRQRTDIRSENTGEIPTSEDAVPDPAVNQPPDPAMTERPRAEVGKPGDPEEPGEPDGTGPVPQDQPAPKPGLRWTPGRVAAAVVLVFLVAAGAVAGSAHVLPGGYIAHPAFEQCLGQNRLAGEPTRGPQRTIAEWAHVVAYQTPDNTTYTIRDQNGALQATVVFTPSAQAARTVLNADSEFDNTHHIFNSDFTINDTTVVTAQVDGPKNVAGRCAIGT